MIDGCGIWGFEVDLSWGGEGVVFEGESEGGGELGRDGYSSSSGLSLENVLDGSSTEMVMCCLKVESCIVFLTTRPIAKLRD